MYRLSAIVRVQSSWTFVHDNAAPVQIIRNDSASIVKQNQPHSEPKKSIQQM